MKLKTLSYRDCKIVYKIWINFIVNEPLLSWLIDWYGMRNVVCFFFALDKYSKKSIDIKK